MWLNNPERKFLDLLSSNFFAKDKKIDIAYINGFESLEKRPITGEIESGAPDRALIELLEAVKKIPYPTLVLNESAYLLNLNPVL